MRHRSLISLLFAWLALATGTAVAQSVDPFEHGWTLDSAASTLRFATVKNDRVAENNRFAELSGSIGPDGSVRLGVDLETVDTGIDIRNVRLRFIFFETFLFREAVVTTQLDAAAAAVLAREPELTIELPFTLALHGVEQQFKASVNAVRLDFDRIAVRSMAPIAIPMEPFGLDGGRLQLQSTANVEILPLVFVTFDLEFQRNARGTRPPTAAITQVAAQTGQMSRPECLARISALSRLGDIGFESDSATLLARSNRTMEKLYDIANRCSAHRIEIGGHMDDSGSAQGQRRLSTERAQAVADVLTAQGIPKDRLVVVGYGGARPIVPNTSDENRAQNRRIEFRMLN